MAKESLKMEIEPFPVVRYFTWKLEFFSDIFTVVVVIIYLKFIFLIYSK